MEGQLLMTVRTLYVANRDSATQGAGTGRRSLTRMPNVVVALITAGMVSVGGCGQVSATPQVPALPTPPTTVPVTGPATGQPVTVLGVIRAGALPGCETLLAEDGTHYLLLDTTDPPRDVPVEVTGVPDPSLVSYCNGGRPLHVQRISRR
jgi:hypothetical protein